jgi:hypothetical protein
MRFRLLLMCVLLFWSLTTLSGQDIIWQQEYQAQYDGMNTCAYSGGFEYTKPAFVDIDNDGDMDCFVGYSDENGVYYIRNDGSPSSPVWIMVSRNIFDFKSNMTAPTFADIDGDGDFDAFIGGHDGRIRFVRNTGTASAPSWNLETEYFESMDFGGHSAPTFCDTDNDGDLDLFVGNNDGVVQYYRNDGTAAAYNYVLANNTFATATAGQYTVPAFCDIDGDGDQDLFIGSTTEIYFYRNDGTAASGSWSLTYTNYEMISTEIYAAPAFVDLDNDSDFDMVAGESHRGMAYYDNFGTALGAAWQMVTRYYMSIDVQYPCFPSFCDIDDDGDHDLFIGRYYNDIYMLTNTGTAEVPAWETTETEYIQTSSIPVFCDIDDDGDYDLFVGTNEGTLEYYQNAGSPGSPVWAAVVKDYGGIDFTDGYCSPAFGDLDDDGDLDLLLGENLGELYYCENTGTAHTPSWAAPDPDWFNPGLTFWERLMPALTDVDLDGDLDLFIGGNHDQVAFFRNEGTAAAPNFALVSDSYLDDQVEYQTRPTFCDIDNDGDPDMFVGISLGGILFWRNMGVTGVEEEGEELLPQEFSLAQNFPNPFNPQTAIDFHVSQTCQVVLKVFNLQGQEISVLVNKIYSQGRHRVLFDGQGLPAGIYFYQIRMKDFQEVRKMVLTK